MKEYNIEGNIDFFSELYKSLDIEENEEKTSDDSNLCLITNEILIENFVELECGHKFNYIPLFNDVKNHKNKFNYLEGKTSHLKPNELRCPYCRNKQETLLPYYEDLGLEKTHGVNFIDPTKNIPPKCNNNNNTKCDYLIVNKDFDPTVNTESKYTNSQYFKCIHYGYFEISSFIEGYTGEQQHFCHLHKNKKIKEHNKLLKDKAKEEAKKKKEEEKKNNEEAKIKAKEENVITKKKNKLKVENVVIGEINITSDINIQEVCIEILKSGPNKGKQCGFKVFDGSHCKRHTKCKKTTESIDTK